MEKKFEDYGFKPSAVIEGLNRWYDAGDKHSLIRFAVPDGRPEHYHFFYDHDKVIDDAIKYLRSFDIFYTPGMKWDDVKFKLSAEACNAEFGYSCVTGAWPKVNPAIDQRKFRDGEVRDYILKNMDANGIKIPESFRVLDTSAEDLIAYLFGLLIQEREDKELIKRENGIRVAERESMIRKYIIKHAEDEHVSLPKSLKDQRVSVENLIAYLVALLMQERKNKELAKEVRDWYCEKNARLQEKLEMWERFYKRQKKLMEDKEE